jgi:hypothetical protein
MIILSEFEMTDAKKKFTIHKSRAKDKGTGFELTFEQWLNIWLESGHWHERGKKKGQYVMSRKGDVGPYAIDNVYINTHANNIREAWLGRKRGPASNEHKELNRISQLGKKQSQATIDKKVTSYKETVKARTKSVVTYN